jgi:hypothetical protein
MLVATVARRKSVRIYPYEVTRIILLRSTPSQMTRLVRCARCGGAACGRALIRTRYGALGVRDAGCGMRGLVDEPSNELFENS